MNISEKAMEAHYAWRGKIAVTPTVRVESKDDLSVAYTPGVAAPCLAIEQDPALSYELTRRWNTVAVITDGSAVLGLGDIGPLAGMPVMEGKCLLFSEFAGIDAFPLCVDTQDPDALVETIAHISKSFGGINLEDISAPRCFEVERRLKELCDIPVFHDDQHGTAVVVTAALQNALKIVGKKKEDLKVVINGPGAAGCAIGRLLMNWGVRNLIFVGRHGALHTHRDYHNKEHEALAKISNPNEEMGTLADVIVGADVFVGVSFPGLLTGDMVRTMAKDAIVFAMANPTPEIDPQEAFKAGARVVGTGRSDTPNQINNLLAFPGIFRGALDVRAAQITEDMKMAAANAIASLVGEDELREDYIIPSPLDRRVAQTVAKAVAEAWKANPVV